MFTTWDQVKDWITDNNFPHWIFSTKPFGADEKDNVKIIDSNQFVVSDFQDKLDMTEKYLRMAGQRLYGVGFKTPIATQGGIICEVRLQDEVTPAQGVGMQPQQPQINIGEIEDRVRKQIRAELREEDFKKREAELDKREKEFAEKEQSAIGALVRWFGPIGQAWMQSKMPMHNVAGLDTDGPAHVQPMIPDGVTQENPEEQSPFTPEEEDEIYTLITEWKAVEPNYLQMLRTVVQMAKSGDATYKMAKGVLVK